MGLKNLVSYLKSPFFSLSLIFLALTLIYESSVGSEGVLFILIYESMMLSMFLLVIMGKENLPGDVDFVALLIVSMPAIVLLFSGTFFGVIAGVLLIGGFFGVYLALKNSVVKGRPKVKKAVLAIFLLSFGCSLLQGGLDSFLRSVPQGLFMVGLILLLAILWKSLK
ncbi:membrane protein of unknown function [Thermococcus nautili]|uniref:hypothetical protein n=1 Tax=Thermococcus nautili TaxID=195522 RepID=UPI002555CF3D|nr:hypothetical protein [Thermococcus nautili]CAI1492701.1 membrane protein of unknown function [Thermococcus nautili]